MIQLNLFSLSKCSFTASFTLTKYDWAKCGTHPSQIWAGLFENLLLSASYRFTSARIGVTLRKSPSVSTQERHRIVGTLVVITVIFIVVFGPYHLVGGYRFVALLLTEDTCHLERSLYLYYRICYGLTSLNTLLDPLFYIFLCHNARHELRRSMPCLSKAQSHQKEVQVKPKVKLKVTARGSGGVGGGHTRQLDQSDSV